MSDDHSPNVTAWALNEMSSDERDRFERECLSSPDSLRDAEATREFCEILGGALSPSADVSLTDAQRVTLTANLADPTKIAPFEVVEGGQTPARRWTRRILVLSPLAVAAAVAILVVPQIQDPHPASMAVAPAASAKRQSVAENGEPPQAVTGPVISKAPMAGPEDEADRMNRPPSAPPRLLREELSRKSELADDAKSRWAGGAAGGAGAAPTAAEGMLQSAVGGSPGQPQPVPRSKTTVQDAEWVTDAAPGKPAAPPPAESIRARSSQPLALRTASSQDQPVSPPDGTTETLRSDSRISGNQPLTAPEPTPAAAAGDKAMPGRPLTVDRLSTEPGPASSESKAVDFSLGSAPATPDGNGLPKQLAGEGEERRRRETPPRSFRLPSPVPGAPQAESSPALPATDFGDHGVRGQVNLERGATDVLSVGRNTPSNELYEKVPENPFAAVAQEPLSTFSIDVDTASYANVRRFLNAGQVPPPAAVRLEEMVNYFSYSYPQPEGEKPFSVTVDLAECPWKPVHRLARIGLKGKEIATDRRPPGNLVFLVDVSGSMDEPNKLPLVKKSLHLLADGLGENDRVAMVVYAGNSGLVLDSTRGDRKAAIHSAIDNLSAGGSTNGGQGIQLAYQVATQNFRQGGVNRVILCTDGDFNVGVTSRADLLSLITEKAGSGTFLTVLGYGMGNLKDATMEMLADKGNGNYAYIDGLGEARKVLGEQLNGTLVTIAKDVKIQIEFNPAQVRGYRLLGYENRLLAREDFNDDTKDAGEIGAGHTVTALYELIPAGAPMEPPPVDGLKYQPTVAAKLDDRLKEDRPASNETMTVKLRYKKPDGDKSELIEVPVTDAQGRFAESPADMRFAAAVAEFGMILKNSAHRGTTDWARLRQTALQSKGPDPLGYRGEFIQLIDRAEGLK